MQFAPFTGDAAHVRRPDYCPRIKRPFYEHYKVTPERNHQLVILSSRLECVLTHAVDSRTQPCTGEGENCHVSHVKHGIRWQGWLWVREAGAKAIRTVTLTPGTMADVPDLLNPSIDFRGRKLTLWRKDRRLRSMLRGRLDDSFWALDYLPEVPSMMSHLVGLWSAPPRSDHNRDCPASIEELRATFVPTGVGG